MADGEANMYSPWRDVRYALRTFSANRLFAASAILSLGLAIGVTTAVFSFTDAVLLRPLPWRDANRLVMMWGSKTTEVKLGLSGPDLNDLRVQNRCFQDVVPFFAGNSTSGSDSEDVNEFGAGTGFLSLLGVRPYLGRAFRPEDSEPGNDRVAIISYSFWKARFGGDPKAVGRSFVIAGEPYTVIGVTPSGFFFPDEHVQAWVPLSREMLSGVRGGSIVYALARLKPGVTIPEAQNQVDTIVSRLKAMYPQDQRLVMGVFSLADQILGSYRAATWSLFGGALLLLMIACANVAHLLLARAMRRGPEISVRVTLGATHGAIFQQLLTESLLLAVGGGIVGILIAYWGMRLLLLEHLADIPRFGEAGINGAALLFALGISLVSGLLFGMFPALHASRPNLTASLKQGGVSYSFGARSGLRDLLMVSEVAFAFVLIASAGLLVNSFVRLATIQWGFRPEHVLIVDSSPANSTTEFIESALSRLKALPGVLSSSVSRGSLITGWFGASTTFTLDGYRFDNVRFSVVGPDYFKTLGIRVVRGREFTNADGQSAPRVAIIDKRLAAQLWPGQNPVGKTIPIRALKQDVWDRIMALGPEKADRSNLWNGPNSQETIPFEVVGEVEPVLTYGPMQPRSSDIYMNYPQRIPGLNRVGNFYIRTSTNPSSLGLAARTAVEGAAPGTVVYNVDTLEHRVQGAIGGHGSNKLLALVSSVTGALGLLLAALGIYGVLAYATVLRTREIGVRIALGAQRSTIFRMVIGRGLVLTVAGLFLGFYGAMQTTRALSGYLFQIKPMDPLTLAGAAVIFLLAAFLACYIPARRAMRLDPLTALRYE